MSLPSCATRCATEGSHEEIKASNVLNETHKGYLLRDEIGSRVMVWLTLKF
jgi:hypothetical protein